MLTMRRPSKMPGQHRRGAAVHDASAGWTTSFTVWALPLPAVRLASW